MTWVVLSAVVLLAWSNGSNDNFKGVSNAVRLWECGIQTALAWAMVTQLAGSLLTLALAAGLVKTFSTRGLGSRRRRRLTNVPGCRGVGCWPDGSSLANRVRATGGRRPMA